MKITKESSPIRVRKSTHKKLMRIKRERGWSIIDAIDRMAEREVESLKLEQQTASARQAA